MNAVIARARWSYTHGCSIILCHRTARRSRTTTVLHTNSRTDSPDSACVSTAIRHDNGEWNVKKQIVIIIITMRVRVLRETSRKWISPPPPVRWRVSLTPWWPSCRSAMWLLRVRWWNRRGIRDCKWTVPWRHARVPAASCISPYMDTLLWKLVPRSNDTLYGHVTTARIGVVPSPLALPPARPFRRRWKVTFTRFVDFTRNYWFFVAAARRVGNGLVTLTLAPILADYLLE